MKKISPISWIVFAIGEIILILCFFLLLDNLARDIFWLDLGVATLTYVLLFFRSVRPMVDLDDRAGRDVSILGLSWVSVILYSVAAIGLMIGMQYNDVEFNYQLMAQIVLAFILLLALIAGSRMSAKRVEVFNEQRQMVSDLDRLRGDMRDLERTVAISSGLPAGFKSNVADISSQLRFLSPCNNPEATKVEGMLSNEIIRINSLCGDFEVNAEEIDRCFMACRQLLKERKSIYSR